MTLRSGDVNDPFTIANGESWNDGMHYYTNLPFEVQRRFPMYGTTDINTGDANVLVLTRKMMAYLLRHRSWNNVPLDGWKLISTGNYLGPLITDGNIDLYQKAFSKGTYILDNNSGMYLFSDILEGQGGRHMKLHYEIYYDTEAIDIQIWVLVQITLSKKTLMSCNFNFCKNLYLLLT